MYMKSEQQAIFINYAPFHEFYEIVPTPTTYCGDQNLSKRWAEIDEKLITIAREQHECVENNHGAVPS
ncbi:unnamed protein product [Gongylonema pulchrum]|uniref:MADF domain-containing protein n=1 Tax=Gongylonema pulchrum TaxID=637853 RepID=A0A183DAH2_9BILA|nr:unnamed protein product [Gongylonema pulchrum]